MEIKRIDPDPIPYHPVAIIFKTQQELELFYRGIKNAATLLEDKSMSQANLLSTAANGLSHFTKTDR